MVAAKSIAVACLLATAAMLAACVSHSTAGTVDEVAVAPRTMDPPKEALPVGATQVATNPAAQRIVATGVAPTKSFAEPKDGVDHRCKIDSDCAVKDVGSCCGYFPQCVNKASVTFPEQVKAQCASEGRMSVCGFPAISGCTCVKGQCNGVLDPAQDNGRVQ